MDHLIWHHDFQVTAVGPTAMRCVVINWLPDATGVTVFVACADANGVAHDSRFALVGFV